MVDSFLIRLKLSIHTKLLELSAVHLWDFEVQRTPPYQRRKIRHNPNCCIFDVAIEADQSELERLLKK